MSGNASGSPIIDISPLFETINAGGSETRQQCVAAIKQACLSVGFFTATGTGISQELIECVYQQSASFHSLDTAAKQPYRSSTQWNSRGWIPLHEEPAYDAGTIAHVESFNLGLDLSPDDPDYTPDSLLGPNVYPDLPNFRADVDTYYAKASQMGQVLLEALAEMLNLERYTFRRMSSRRAGSSMRMLDYPGRVSAANQPLAESSTVGISAHSDFELLTIMHQTASGLQFLTRDGEWLDAPIIAGGLNVIVDDGLEILTNGKLQATKHRVPLTNWQRYSLVFFHAANIDQILQPLPQFVSAENLPRYTPITQADHIRQQMQSGLENLARASSAK